MSLLRRNKRIRVRCEQRLSEALHSKGSSPLDRPRLLLGILMETEFSLLHPPPPPAPPRRGLLLAPWYCQGPRLQGRLASPSSEQMSSRWPSASQGQSLQLFPASDENKFGLKQGGFNKTQKTELIPGQHVFRTERNHEAQH